MSDDGKKETCEHCPGGLDKKCRVFLEAVGASYHWYGNICTSNRTGGPASIAIAAEHPYWRSERKNAADLNVSG
ncbi:hypothetical protein Y1Q_0002150 [Alligator mississippiensis]|uniref:Uncharacterized protein n=1 Tax=Alligator mississippiensis TaxID=8496 RepID=A0A151MPT6_ALLMI|nr:hypothetical protein Y1Q_0002150 [Alligator mississippiensis]